MAGSDQTKKQFKLRSQRWFGAQRQLGVILADKGAPRSVRRRKVRFRCDRCPFRLRRQRFDLHKIKPRLHASFRQAPGGGDKVNNICRLAPRHLKRDLRAFAIPPRGTDPRREIKSRGFQPRLSSR